MNDQPKKQAPATKFKRGSIEAAIFENHKDGKTWHNVSINRRYKSSSGEFRSVSTYAFADLVQVARIAEQAEQWITARMEELGTEKPAASPDENI
jgi:hypothetical protein